VKGICIIAAVAVILFNCADVYAHVSYVLPEEEFTAYKMQYPDLEVLALGMLIVTMLVATAQFTTLHFRNSYFVTAIMNGLAKYDDYVPVLLRAAAGVFLIGSGIVGGLLSNEQQFVDQDIVPFLTYIQIGAGMMLLAGFLVKVAAIMLLGLFSSTFFVYGVYGIDQFMILGISVVIFFEGGVIHAIDKYMLSKSAKAKIAGEKLLRLKPASMPLLRVTLGMTLIWLGLTEKLLAPDLFIAVIEKYQVPIIGDLELFVFLTGIIEILIGIHYLLGIFIRLISGLFLIILTITLLIFGENVISHILLFTLAVVFIIRGAGPWRVDPVLKEK